MDLVPFSSSVAAITGGTIVSVTISGSTFIGGTLSGSVLIGVSISGSSYQNGTISGSTIAAPTISGGTAVGLTLSGCTFLGGSISGSTITSAGGALSGTTFNAPVISGGTMVTTTLSGVTVAGTIAGAASWSGLQTFTGIAFANETLSTYDKGTFTPTLEGDGTTGTPTYVVQVGRFIRVGDIVHCYAHLAISAKTGIAGNIIVNSLPFTSKNVTDLSPAAAIGYYDGFTFGVGRTQMVTLLGPNRTYINLYSAGSAVGIVTITDAGIAAATEVSISFSYEI